MLFVINNLTKEKHFRIGGFKTMKNDKFDKQIVLTLEDIKGIIKDFAEIENNARLDKLTYGYTDVDLVILR